MNLLASMRLLALAALTGTALAQTPAPTLRIEGPWLRATPNGAKVAAGYFTVTNTGPETDRLLGGRVPFAGRVEVHEMAITDGFMKMRSLADGLDIPPGKTIDLKPGSNHLMFQELNAGLKEGETVEGTLVFQKAGTVSVVFRVGGIGGPPPASGHRAH